MIQLVITNFSAILYILHSFLYISCHRSGICHYSKALSFCVHVSSDISRVSFAYTHIQNSSWVHSNFNSRTIKVLLNLYYICISFLPLLKSWWSKTKGIIELKYAINTQLFYCILHNTSLWIIVLKSCPIWSMKAFK